MAKTTAADYDRLDELKLDIVNRAIEASMSFGLWTGSAESGFDYSWSDGAPSNPSAQTHTAHAPGPVRGTRVAPVEIGPTTFDVQSEVYDKWFAAIDAAFESWDDLPRPDGFTSQVDAVGRAAFHVCGEASLDDTQLHGTNPALRSLMAIPGEIAPFNGDTIDAFYLNFAAPLPGFVRGCYNIANLLTMGVAGEKELWKNSRAAVASIAIDAATAMEGAHYQAGSSTKFTIKVIGSFLAGASLVLSGGTSAPIIGGVTAVLGELDKYLPDDTTAPSDAKLKKTHGPLGDSDPDKVLENLLDALDVLNTDITTEENRIDAFLGGGSSTVGDHPHQWTLGRPVGLLASGDRDGIISDDHDEIAVDFETMETVGDQYMGDVARQLHGACDQLHAARHPDPWCRPGVIGTGAYGPYFSFEGLLDTLGQLMTDNAQSVEEAGHVLVLAARDMNATDDQVDSELRAYWRQIRDSQPGDFTPPPPPPPPHMQPPGGLATY